MSCHGETICRTAIKKKALDESLEEKYVKPWASKISHRDDQNSVSSLEVGTGFKNKSGFTYNIFDPSEFIISGFFRYSDLNPNIEYRISQLHLFLSSQIFSNIIGALITLRTVVFGVGTSYAQWTLGVHWIGENEKVRRTGSTTTKRFLEGNERTEKRV
ncbi:hypothetical protein RhiirA4_442094, partial [Rhizophagus irregularis]